MQFLKKVYRDWCPPKLRVLVNEVRGHKIVVNTYEGVYQTFSECAKACNSDHIYMDPDSDDKEAKIFWNLVKHRSNSGPVVGRNIFVPLVISLKKNKSIAILDVGGASNPIISKISQENSKSIDYFVLDRPEIGHYIRQYGDEPGIKIVDKLEDVKTIKKYKIMYFGSSIQYIHDNDQLSALFSWDADMIIVADSVFSDGNDLWVKQINMTPLIFPNHWWSLKKLNSIAKSHKYHLVNQMVTSTGAHLHNTLGNSFYQTLIFKRS